VVAVSFVPNRSWHETRLDELSARVRELTGPAMQTRIALVRDEDLVRDGSGKFRVVIGRRPA
jgi:hypothetical protein